MESQFQFDEIIRNWNYEFLESIKYLQDELPLSLKRTKPPQ